MKPVYETERRSTRLLLAPILLVIGVLGVFILGRVLVAQVVIQTPAPPLVDATTGVQLELPSTPTPAPKSPKKWEFKIVMGPDEEALNAAAAEGFAWVTTEVMPARGPGSAPAMVTILQRRKPADAKPAKTVLESAPKSSSTDTAESSAEIIVRSPAVITQGGLTFSPDHPAVLVASAAPPVQKYEYKLLPAISESGLNSAAKEGWEVDCIYGQNTAILKRPLRGAAGAAVYVPLDGGPAPALVPASPPESDKRLLPLYRDPTK